MNLTDTQKRQLKNRLIDDGYQIPSEMNITDPRWYDNKGAKKSAKTFMKVFPTIQQRLSEKGKLNGIANGIIIQCEGSETDWLRYLDYAYGIDALIYTPRKGIVPIACRINYKYYATIPIRVWRESNMDTDYQKWKKMPKYKKPELLIVGYTKSKEDHTLVGSNISKTDDMVAVLDHRGLHDAIPVFDGHEIRFIPLEYKYIDGLVRMANQLQHGQHNKLALAQVKYWHWDSPNNN